jgi:hypothetical protein
MVSVRHNHIDRGSPRCWQKSQDLDKGPEIFKEVPDRAFPPSGDGPVGDWHGDVAAPISRPPREEVTVDYVMRTMMHSL